MQASELYALSQSNKCKGNHLCHWCGGPCTTLLTHDDLDPIPFVRSKAGARRPADAYMCIGCWLFRRKSVTAFYLDGSFKDRRCPMLLNWWMEPDQCVAIDLKNERDKEELFLRLTNPPKIFCLMLIDDASENMLHRALVNDNQEVLSGTPLKFTLANIPHEYVPYEIEDILYNDADSNGKSSGSRVLAEMLKGVTQTKTRGKGRPSSDDGPNDKRHRKLIRKSG